jgi:glycosyltransferase involved in cell wall biosynthesis
MDRICMYTPSARGGHALYTAELLTALTRHPAGGPRFELLTSQDIDPAFVSGVYPVNAILPPLAHRGQFRTRLGWAVNRSLHYSRRDRCFLKWLAGRPDIAGVHLQEYFPWRPAPLFRGIRRLRRKIFYTVHNLSQHAYPPLLPRRVWDHLSRSAWRLADCLFVLTPELGERLSRLLGPGHPPIRVVPHGVWTVNGSAHIPALTERLTWKRLLFFGTIRRNKGLDLLLDAAESLPGYSFTIAGEPLDPDYFNEEVLPRIRQLQSRGVPIQLVDRFTSEQEAGALFASHSAIVLPYTQQFASQSGVAFLALAHELPIVASEVGGLRDLFRQFPIGHSFTDLTSAGLAAAVHSFFDGNHRDQLLGQIRAAKQFFSWETAAAATLAGYAACLEGGPQR